jgi:hypothetical protein
MSYGRPRGPSEAREDISDVTDRITMLDDDDRCDTISHDVTTVGVCHAALHTRPRPWTGSSFRLLAFTRFLLSACTLLSLQPWAFVGGAVTSLSVLVVSAAALPWHLLCNGTVAHPIARPRTSGPKPTLLMTALLPNGLHRRAPPNRLLETSIIPCRHPLRNVSLAQLRVVPTSLSKTLFLWALASLHTSPRPQLLIQNHPISHHLYLSLMNQIFFPHQTQPLFLKCMAPSFNRRKLSQRIPAPSAPRHSLRTQRYIPTHPHHPRRKAHVSSANLASPQTVVPKEIATPVAGLSSVSSQKGDLFKRQARSGTSVVSAVKAAGKILGMRPWLIYSASPAVQNASRAA